MRQSVSDPKWWENLSPVTCNRFVTPCVALPLHLSPDLRRFPPNSGALEAVKLLHTSAAVHSPNLLIISLPVILHKTQGNAYVCFITNLLAAKKETPKDPPHIFNSRAQRNVQKCEKHTLHKWRVISQQLMWLLEPPKIGIVGILPRSRCIKMSSVLCSV